ncbi:hypothetical protein PHISCL_05877 [Aspergillus sclerotialis]|uniref:Uncharacterized protein n=1 Tax=Aspergillus sclerotialis TaxID=2070753 RepID=A0A3A2ZFL7_9EURO|nr:hypothetical protein PHISCL_05877 [Aspergillus sclerotialis]
MCENWPCEVKNHKKKNCQVYDIQLDITNYGPFPNKYAAVFGAKMAFLDKASNRAVPAFLVNNTDDRIYFYIELHAPNDSDMVQMYKDLAARLEMILSRSMEDNGRIYLPNMEGSRMYFSQEFPDV